MNRTLLLRTALLLYCLSSTASAYEQATHAVITSQAFIRSELGNPILSSNLGLPVYWAAGTNATYYDIAEFITADSKTWKDYETNIIRDVREVSDSSPRSWLLRGAIREDDNPNEDPPTPQDISPSLRRPLHHFFDPFYNRALTSTGLFILDSDIHKNPDWAIGSRDSFNAPNNREIGRRNHFSIFDAREAMFRALTLKRLNQDGSFSDVDSTADSAARYLLRKAYWATTFRALGDVLHLVQDMAQPQHTRNEPHSGMGCLTQTAFCLGGHASIYERYINARILGTKKFTLVKPFNAPIEISPAALDFGTYPLPSFAKYGDYWSTSPGIASLSGQGMADYSNRGFFTAKYNFGNSEFPQPSSVAGYTMVPQPPVRWDGSGISNGAPVYFYRATVRDTLTGQDATNVALTSYSVWDQFMQSRSLSPSFSLNRQNYDAMADLLIPRAVAYSAGLINFFFRGRIEISLPAQGAFALADHAHATGSSGFKKLRAKVKNGTSAIMTANQGVHPQGMTGGSLFAVVRYHDDLAYRENLSGIVGAASCAAQSSVFDNANPEATTLCRNGIEEIVVSARYPIALSPNEEREIQFDFSDAPIPLAATDLQLQVVYRGALGGEGDAVVVGTADISEPTYFTFHNASDYISIGAEIYTRAQIDANPGLLDLVYPPYCVDQSQSPPRTRDTCFKPFDLDLELAFGNADPATNPTISVSALPGRRFLRIVYLTSADYSDYKRTTAEPTIRASIRPSRYAKSDTVGQLGYCLPHDDYHIVMRAAQYVETGARPGYYLGVLDSLRGINGWLQTACVNSGDGQVGKVPYANMKVADDLTDDNEETSPFEVTIAADFAP